MKILNDNVTFILIMLYFIFLGPLHHSSTLAGIPPEDLQDLDKPINGEYLFLSPIYGAIYTEGHIPENIGELFKKGDAEAGNPVRLVNNLYNRTDADTYLPSRKGGGPAPYLHPNLIGKVMGYLSNLKKWIEDNPKAKEQFIKQKIKTAADSLKKILTDDIGWINTAKEFKLQEEKTTALIKELEEKTHPSQGEIETLENLKKMKKLQETNELKVNLNQMVTDLLEGVTNPKTYKILSSVLWHKVLKKEDFLEFYKGLYEQNPKAMKWDPRASDPKWGNWLKASFDSKQTPALDSGSNLAETFYYAQKERQKNRPLLNYGTAEVEGVSYPNCGENSLLNVVRILLNRDGTYDVEILKEMEKKTGYVSPLLIQYFKDFPHERDQGTEKAKIEWAKVLANLNQESVQKNLSAAGKTKFVHYRIDTEKVSCNIAGTSGNMLMVVGKVFNIHSWKEFSQVASEGGKRPFGLTENLNSHGFGTLKIETEHEGNFTWYFKSGHYYLEPVLSESFLMKGREKIYKLPEKRDLLSLIPTNEEYIRFLVEKAVEDKSPDSLHYAHYRTDDERVSLMEELFSRKDELPFPLSDKGLHHLYRNLTIDDARMRFLKFIPLHLVKDEVFSNEVIRLMDDSLNHQRLATYVFSQTHWKNHPRSAEWLEQLISVGKADGAIAAYVLSQPYWKEHSRSTHWMEKLISAGTADWPITAYVLSKPHWQEHPQSTVWLEKILSAGKADRALAINILSQPHWQKHPRATEWLEKILLAGKADEAICAYVLSQPYWQKHPLSAVWLEKLISREKADEAIATFVLSQPGWQDHPQSADWLKKLITAGRADEEITSNILSQPHWSNDPFLKQLIGEAPLTVENIRKALKERSVKGALKNLENCHRMSPTSDTQTPHCIREEEGH